MADFDCKNDELGIFDVAKYAIIANAIAPFIRMVSNKALSKSPRVFAAIDMLQEPRDYYAPNTWIHFG